MEKDIIFDFKFTLTTINEHLIKWCREHGIDWFCGHLGGIFANVKGGKVYYQLVPEFQTESGKFAVSVDYASYEFKC